jgi:glycosyltransferase involved in cell wall biosynthesis
MVRACGGGNIYLRGFVKDVSEVYDACSLYIQPSASEGFGIEVIEASAHGRPVLCSDGAGAWPHARQGVPRCNSQALADAIDQWRAFIGKSSLEDVVKFGLSEAKALTWDEIKRRYCFEWAHLVGVWQ